MDIIKLTVYYERKVNKLLNSELVDLLECKIRVRLAELNKSQKELAEHMGVTIQTMSGWATGRVIPSLEKAFMIADYLDCKVDDLWIYKANGGMMR